MTKKNRFLYSVLFPKSNRKRFRLVWITLCLGTTFLFLSVLVWWNLRYLLCEDVESEVQTSSFLTINKSLDDSDTQRHTFTFNPAELSMLQHAPEVEQVGVLVQNHFPASLNLTSDLIFSSEVFLESVPEQFLDQKPPLWHWHPGSSEVPIIVPSEFLHLYNDVYAPGRGLRQLSQRRVQALAFDLVAGPPHLQETYTARVVGFTDRFITLLVPVEFMNYANQRYGNIVEPAPSRIVLKVKDPSDQTFAAFLERNGYVANKEQMRWSKARSVMEVGMDAIGTLMVMFAVLSVVLSGLTIHWAVTPMRTSFMLLQQLGYRPSVLRVFVIKRLILRMSVTIIAALVFVVIAQWVLAKLAADRRLLLPFIPDWSVWSFLIVYFLLLVMLVTYFVRRAMKIT